MRNQCTSILIQFPGQISKLHQKISFHQFPHIQLNINQLLMWKHGILQVHETMRVKPKLLSLYQTYIYHSQISKNSQGLINHMFFLQRLQVQVCFSHTKYDLCAFQEEEEQFLSRQLCAINQTLHRIHTNRFKVHRYLPLQTNRSSYFDCLV